MPEKRYIEAGALKHEINTSYGSVMDAVIVNRIIDSAPTADVAEVVHGYVKCVSKSTFEQYEPSVYACSVCGKNIPPQSKFCKECGAMLDLGGSEHE